MAKKSTRFGELLCFVEILEMLRAGVVVNGVRRRITTSQKGVQNPRYFSHSLPIPTKSLLARSNSTTSTWVESEKKDELVSKSIRTLLPTYCLVWQFRKSDVEISYTTIDTGVMVVWWMFLKHLRMGYRHVCFRCIGSKWCSATITGTSWYSTNV